ncbi:hypothetical protein TB1_032280 [Malus domestica]
MKGETLGEGKNWTYRQGRERQLSPVDPAAKPSTLRSTLLKDATVEARPGRSSWEVKGTGRWATAEARQGAAGK